MHKDRKGHFTDKANDGGECRHGSNGGRGAWLRGPAAYREWVKGNNPDAKDEDIDADYCSLNGEDVGAVDAFDEEDEAKGGDEPAEAPAEGKEGRHIPEKEMGEKGFDAKCIHDDDPKEAQRLIGEIKSRFGVGADDLGDLTGRWEGKPNEVSKAKPTESGEAKPSSIHEGVLQSADLMGYRAEVGDLSKEYSAKMNGAKNADEKDMLFNELLDKIADLDRKYGIKVM